MEGLAWWCGGLTLWVAAVHEDEDALGDGVEEEEALVEEREGEEGDAPGLSLALEGLQCSEDDIDDEEEIKSIRSPRVSSDTEGVLISPNVRKYAHEGRPPSTYPSTIFLPEARTPS